MTVPETLSVREEEGVATVCVTLSAVDSLEREVVVMVDTQSGTALGEWGH